MLSAIAVVDKNMGIGKNNKLMCYLPDDLKYFKKTTLNKSVIMGRKTFESIGKELKDRKNIVLTKNKFFTPNNKNIIIENNINKILQEYENSEEEAFIIGGSLIFKEFINNYDKIYLTKIDMSFNADVFFPDVDFKNYKLIKDYKNLIDTKTNIPFKIEIYKKIKP